LLRRILRDLDGLHVRLDLLHGDLWFGREPRALAA
jgi:fructosamine-3-kinase